MRTGSVLILVLIVVALLTLSSYTYFDLMFNEKQGSNYYGRAIQSEAFAESGVEYVKFFLAQQKSWRDEAGGFFDNPERMRGMLIADSNQAAFRGRASIVAPALDQGYFSGVRFGLEDESARINLNTILLVDSQQENGARTLLMRMPGMTESIADAILDWLDADDEPRQFGAEREYYSALEPGYEPTNGPLATIEQLLLVRDITPSLLFGYDLNRNAILDNHERTGESLGDSVNNDNGVMDRGWSAYFTLHSAESNRRPDGQPRIDVNSDDLRQLHSDIETAIDLETANFIIAFRQGEVTEDSDEGRAANSITLDFEREGRTRLNSLLDLIGVSVSVELANSTESTIVATPFGDSQAQMGNYMPQLMENLTVNSAEMIPGRISVNRAPRVILEGLPGLESGLADTIVGTRDMEVPVDRPNRQFATWLLTEGLVNLQQMKRLTPLVTGEGHVYRAQFVGYFEAEGPISRLEVIVDATADEPRVVHRRDLSPLGPGYARDLLTGSGTTISRNGSISP